MTEFTNNKYRVLKEFFGYNSFRPGREEIIDRILSGRDVLGIMPTGAGKSICFRVPALCFDGVTIVISPLVSLMKDRVSALIQNGVSSAFINSTLTEKRLPIALKRIAEKRYKIIYVAPERLSSFEFKRALSSIMVSMVVVDEAHCVSRWGHDFRPDYEKINDFINEFDVRPVVCAFTASATEKVRQDIEKMLGLRSAFVKILSFDRKNLFFSTEKPNGKYETLKKYLTSFSERSGIVYCSTRKNVDTLYIRLLADGFSVTKYHAGMQPIERSKNRDDFLNDRKQICIATNAFGMGIDKSNVSFVIHYNMPGDIESYYREAGRAGRDGSSADCILFWNKRDINTRRFFIENPEEKEELFPADREILRRHKLRRLGSMIDYASGRECLRKTMLSYFGETSEDYCGNCSFCVEHSKNKDITTEAQMILSALVRTKSPQKTETLIDILRGKKTPLILENEFEKLSVFGLMSDKGTRIITDLINHLQKLGYIKKSNDFLSVEASSKEVLFEGKKIRFNDRTTITTGKTDDFDRDLFSKLVSLRKEIAKEKRVPSFIVFSDKVLIEIATVKPTDNISFLSISGIGRKKFESYGKIFIDAVKEYLEN